MGRYGNGLNRFDKATGKFKIYDFRDSVRIGFVWSLLVNYKGDLYAGGTEGLHRYDQVADKFRAVDDDTSINNKLQFNIRNIFEDSNRDSGWGFMTGADLVSS